jgi:hypothetical protein
MFRKHKEQDVNIENLGSGPAPADASLQEKMKGLVVAPLEQEETSSQAHGISGEMGYNPAHGPIGPNSPYSANGGPQWGILGS